MQTDEEQYARFLCAFMWVCFCTTVHVYHGYGGIEEPRRDGPRSPPTLKEDRQPSALPRDAEQIQSFISPIQRIFQMRRPSSMSPESFVGSSSFLVDSTMFSGKCKPPGKESAVDSAMEVLC